MFASMLTLGEKEALAYEASSVGSQPLWLACLRCVET